MIKCLHPFELPWVMVHCSNDLNTIFFVYKFYEKWRRYYAAVTSYQYFISRSITWSCMCTRHCIGICNDGNVTVNVSPSLSWFYCMKHFPWIFCIFSDIFVFKNSWPVYSFHCTIFIYTIFFFPSIFTNFNLSEYYDGIGLLNTYDQDMCMTCMALWHSLCVCGGGQESNRICLHSGVGRPSSVPPCMGIPPP